MNVCTARAHFDARGSFTKSVAELAAETPDDNSLLLRTVVVLANHITTLTEDDPDLAKIIFNDTLNRVDPAWRVKVSD